MVFPRISNPRPTTGNTFGGDVLNKVQEWFSGINIAASDSTNKPGITTDTRFHSGKLILFDRDGTHEIRFVTPSMTSGSVAISVPASLSASENNEIIFSKGLQEMEDKTINASRNVITNLTNTNIAAGAGIAWSKISKTGSALGDIANVNLTGLQDNFSIRWDSGTAKWIVYNVDAIAGEANTMQNLPGTLGAVGVFKQKTGMNFEMKRLQAGSPNVTVIDDVGNNEIDIDVLDASTSNKGIVQLATNVQVSPGLAVQANDSRLTNTRTPTAHATTHKSGGTDSLKINEFAAPTTNITTPNATISANGLLPMLPNASQMFLNGTGGWSEPIGTATGVSGNGSIIRNQVIRSGDGITTVFTIAHGMTITPTAFFVDAISLDALGFSTKSVNATNITITYQVPPKAGTNNLVYTWVVMDAGSGSTLGEANTFSSAGTGVPIPKGKVGSDLIFKSLFAGSNKISILGNPNDVSFDINQANLSIAWTQLTAVPTSFAPSAHAASHLSAGTDPIAAATTAAQGLVELATNGENVAGVVVQGDDSRLSNARTPTAHAASHGTGQSDPVSLSNLVGTITDAQISPNTLTASNIKTVTAKTINLTDNTVIETGMLAGAIPVYNGTKYVGIAKGSDGSFLGVSGGSVGYFTPETASGGGLLPTGDAIPNTGRWGAMWGGTGKGRSLLDISISANSVDYKTINPTLATTIINTAAADDSVAQIKSTKIFRRDSNLVFKTRFSLGSISGMVFMIGFASNTTMPTGGGHDNPLNGTHGVMITCSQDIETNFQISRNDGSVTQTKVATTVAANTTAVRTAEFRINSTDVTVILEGITYGPYTTIIPALTTEMSLFVQVEAIGTTARSGSVRWLQVTCL